jgi:hypothetical protein
MKELKVNSRVIARVKPISGQVGKVTAILGAGRTRKYQVSWSNGTTGDFFSRALEVSPDVAVVNRENVENAGGDMDDAASIGSTPSSSGFDEDFGEFNVLWDRHGDSEDER